MTARTRTRGQREVIGIAPGCRLRAAVYQERSRDRRLKAPAGRGILPPRRLSRGARHADSATDLPGPSSRLRPERGRAPGRRSRPAPEGTEGAGRPRVPAGRPSRGRARLARGRRPRRPAHVLRGHRLGRGVEVHGRRDSLEAGLRRPAHELDRLGRGGAVRPERRLRRLGRGQHPRQRRAGKRHLQVHRRREDVAARVEAGRPDRHDGRPPDEPRRRVRGRPGQALRPQPRARRLSHAGRREDVGEGPLRGPGHRRLRRRARPAEPAHRVRRPVAGAAPALGAGERRPRLLAPRLARRRRHVEEARRQGAPRGDLGQGGRGGGAVSPAARLRARRGRERGALPLGRRGRDVVARERPPRAAAARLVLLDAHRRPEEPRRRVVPAGAHAEDGGRREDDQEREGHPPRRPPRRVDRPREPEADDRRERRRGGRVDRRRGHLVRADAADLAALPRGHRHRGAVPGVRRDAGPRHRVGPEQQPLARRDRARRLAHGGRGRGRPRGGRPFRPERRLRGRVLRHPHPLRPPHAPGAQRRPPGRTTPRATGRPSLATASSGRPRSRSRPTTRRPSTTPATCSSAPGTAGRRGRRSAAT